MAALPAQVGPISASRHRPEDGYLLGVNRGSPLSDPLPDPGLGALIEEWAADLALVGRRYPMSFSAARLDRTAALAEEYRARLGAIPFESLSPAARIDHAVLRNGLARELRLVARRREEAVRLTTIVPFLGAVSELDGARKRLETPDPELTARALDELARAMRLVAPPTDAPAVAALGEARDVFAAWATFYRGYGPELDWWIARPLAEIETEFARLGESPSVAEDGEIPGHPVGRAALEEDLAFDMIGFSPEELIAIGEGEYAWCLDRMREAARELGHGDDWRAALEAVKETYAPPGEQPGIVRDLAWEATEYVRDLVTIPPLAEEGWRMEMMSAEAQRTNPFFLGGEAIIVSAPTSGMTLEERRMSLRGNNPPFSRATVQHELIPGHHLQLYMTERHRPYRRHFGTPFWIEGWTIYWELLLWDLGFPRTPEERIGMLFWRMHRCVRVVFSLGFHLGRLTTAECVEMLVERVGHERLNAEGEVRRSFNGLYPPLYQLAYLIGGLAFREIGRELVDGGCMSRREFHDAILRENELPPALLRLALIGESPSEDRNPAERFPHPAVMNR